VFVYVPLWTFSNSIALLLCLRHSSVIHALQRSSSLSFSPSHSMWLSFHFPNCSAGFFQSSAMAINYLFSFMTSGQNQIPLFCLSRLLTNFWILCSTSWVKYVKMNSFLDCHFKFPDGKWFVKLYRFLCYSHETKSVVWAITANFACHRPIQFLNIISSVTYALNWVVICYFSSIYSTAILCFSKCLL